MPVPKRKTSKSRRDKRRTHWNLNEVNLEECPRCHEMKLPHRACLACGYYNGNKIISTSAEKKDKKEKKK
jgi:large subunit ribosomal protein L32